MALVEVKVPDIGDFKEVAVIELLVKPGDAVKAEQSLITVESDKASMEIPSSHAGVVKEVKVKVGDKVGEGSLVLLLEAAGAAPAAAPPPAPVQTQIAAVAAPAAPTGAASTVVVPDIGDFKDVAVIEVFVKPGDAIKVEQSLITVESDKASMEIPSSHAGVVKEVLVKVGDKVNQGSVLLVLEGSGGAPAGAAPVVASAPQAAPAAPATPDAQAPAMPAHQPTVATGTLPHASPSIRKLARELGVPLAEVQGSGPKGRITQRDIESFVKGVMAGDTQTAAQKAKAPAAAATSGGGIPGLLPWPQVDFAKFGPIERKDLSRIKKISGSLSRADQQGQREERRQGHDARLRHQGRGLGAEEVPGLQRQPRR
jgi:pyruvate dehydrogenase E2 component (dihydrolipoamide acetyltransferase)